ncbi:amino acid adenylation domain-containing protein [Xanthomonas campestris pv. campestris]|uniref:non-ribosomal peptide synthetase n=1 Tax=Xanthomonas campestris TaxID=339 RepID=UPI001E3D049D|nr:non-ribosomal peptide synthetase [Xanthomonas campestris]MCD0254770.1 amino acid adenylation domain-containing protein [Xanthomonas campestris pv. campestris]MEB1300192.1 non-ribosomal peptide synthetase [Xanthomonas campestris pv. campestris]MEB1308986.1 non-ribosomal peptide synthetase [Xanthomonas campestris pv. campestris]MEB1334083.1 non-ribosomal peptide synthetase [Xanthomonas campestris pv. campestris]MEB1899971.1 non-ribosomal peptide synthetase [Xanthomonas campestris pv. campestr
MHAAQEAVFYDQIANPRAAKYNVGGYILLCGDWNLHRLTSALERFWRASEAGRLRIFLQEGQPLQRVQADAPMPSPQLLDFSDQAAGAERARTWMQQRMDTVFEPGAFPLVEHALVRVGEREHLYFLKQHHLIADAYSFGLQAKTVLDCYCDLDAGREPDADLGLCGYGEQVALEQGYAGSPDQYVDAAYWREQLRSAPAPVWPERGQSMSAGSEQAQMEFPSDLRDRLIATAAGVGASPLHALVALLAALVAKSTGRTDLIVGVPVHNRVYRKQKFTVGMLSTVVPARICLDPRAGLRDALASIRSAQTDGLRHRRHRWPAALRDLRSRQPERGQLFDLMANYERFPQWEGPAGLDAEIHELVSGDQAMPLHAKFCDFGPRRPWLLQLDGVPGRLQGRSLDAWAQDLLEVAREVLDDPARPLGEALGLQPAVIVEADRRERDAHFRDAVGLELPLDRPRVLAGKRHSARHRFRCGSRQPGVLQQLAARHDVTPEAVLQACWNLLLGRLCGQEHFVVAIPADPEGVLSGDGSGPPSWVELVAHVPLRQRLSQWLPEWSARLSRARLLHPTVCAAVASGARPPWRTCARFDRGEVAVELPDGCVLAMSVHDSAHGKGLECELDYDTRWLDAATVERWSGHLRVLLDAMTAADAGAMVLDALAWLSPADSEALLRLPDPVDWHLPADTQIQTLVEAQVRRSPDAIALSDAHRRVRYAEMEARSAHLAGQLRARGVAPGATVGVYMERSVDLPIALLAILKAGGAYVPMDLEYPAARLRAMARDSDAKLILIQQHLRAAAELWIPSDPMRAPALLAVDAADEADGLDRETASSQAQRAAADHRAEHLAYVIYTSGSTGEPKGVMNQHDGVVNRLLWAQRQFALGSGDRVLQKTSCAFDVSVWEFFLPLLAGAELVMARPGGQRDPAYLVEAIERCGITIMHFVPSMLQVFLDQIGDAALPSLRCVLCSGEALPASLRDRFLQRLPHVQLHNLYGPTEAAVDVTHLQCAPDDGPLVTIGRPIANTRVLVLDRHGQPVPVGVAGEIHLGGIQVARGYLGRPDLTDARFRQLSLGQASGRYYCTGDLGRLRVDGSIEFLGRNDHQVKIRGLRIELDEVRAHLQALDAVRECEVTKVDALAGPYLAAFVVVEAGADFDAQAARARLRVDLPEHMVPARILRVQAMPLSSNGKLDRAALASMAAQAVSGDDDGRIPRSASERLLAAIVQDLLGCTAVGMDQRLSDLGWHSLLATQAAHRLGEIHQQSVPLMALLEARTLSQVHVELTAALGGSERMEHVADTYWLLDGLSADAVTALLREGLDDPGAVAARLDGLSAA